MPIYFYWGDDEWAIASAVKQLEQTVDSNWQDFNYEKLARSQTDQIAEGLNLALTPPFGSGSRLVWLADTNIGQTCSNQTLQQLETTLPAIPSTNILLFTSSKKPDRRLKSVKILQKWAKFREFSRIAPWKTDEIAQQVKRMAQQHGLRLTPDAVAALATAVGNDTRQLDNELQKLKLYGGSRTLDGADIAPLVVCYTQNSLDLAQAMLHGDIGRALDLAADLVGNNEPPLRIVATLVSQFRAWTIVRLGTAQGENQQAIAARAGIANYRRVFILQKEVAKVKSQQLEAVLPLLLELELQLKQGLPPLITLQTAIVKITNILTCHCTGKACLAPRCYALPAALTNR